MPNYKHDRTAEDIRRELTALLREMKDPRITSSMLTIVFVELASDLSYAKVYVSSMDGIDAAKTAVKALTGATGYFRRELSDRLHIRKAPELKFIADDRVEKTMDLFAKMARLREEYTDTESENED